MRSPDSMSHPIARRIAVAASAALLALPAAAAPFDLLIAPGKSAEHCVKLAAGDAVKYRFETGAPLDFNIHHHRGKEVFYPVKREAVQQMQDQFRAQEADDYCLTWRNKGEQPVTVRGATGD